eukprot:COSAG02_NODE_7319_length_3064_cov_2.951433_2_plen_41_part_00
MLGYWRGAAERHAWLVRERVEPSNVLLDKAFGVCCYDTTT